MKWQPEQFCSPVTNQFRREVLAGYRKDGKNPGVYQLELGCLRLAPFFVRTGKENATIAEELMLNCFRFQWPWFWLEKDGYDNYWAKRMVRALTRWKTLDFLGSASSGKTFTTAAYAYTRWKSSPFNTSVFLSTTTKEGGDARTWGAIKDLFAKDETGTIGTRLDYKNMIVFEKPDEKNPERDYRDSIVAVAIKTGSEGQNAVSSICGRKNEHVIWCCDEMPFMDIGILNARLNLRANPVSQFIGIGNKPTEGDPLYIDAEPFGPQYPDGWKSVSPDNEHWRTRAGACYYFDGEKSPNLAAGDAPPFPRLMTRQMLKDIEEDSGGRDTIGYWTQARGFPVTGDVQDTVLTGSLVEATKSNTEAVWSFAKPIVLAGLDPAFSSTGDQCVVDFIRFGTDISGKKVMMCEPDGVVLRFDTRDKTPYEQQMARRFLDECKSRGCHEVEMDVTGNGGIVAQAIERIAQELNYEMIVHLCSFQGTPSDNSYEVAGKRQPAKELFDRKVSELWYSFRFSVQNGVVRGIALRSNACQQLCQRKVIQDEKKRWRVEKKEDMKKRIRRSPDQADARILAHSLAIRKGLSGSGRSVARVQKNPLDELRRQPRSSNYGWSHSNKPAYS